MFVQPSSLVFLVIIAVWAAYFVQYWVRRREHLATARSVDQFSESMRVLERRLPLPAADLSTPQQRSYAVAPARPARPQILVKRAAPAESRAEGPAESATPRAADRRDVRPVDGRDERRAARRTRAMIMLGALSTVLVSVPLVALGLLPMVTLLVPLVSIGVAVVWVRATAVAEQRARRAARASAAPAPARRPRQAMPVAASPREETVAETAPVNEPEAAPVKETVETRSEPFDVQAVVSDVRTATEPVPSAETVPSAQPAPMRPLVDEDDIPLTWDPVPVPRPTYTMKSRATRPAPAAADLVGDADTEYTAYEQEPVRRVAGA